MMTADEVAGHVERMYGESVREIGRRVHVLASDYVIEEAWQKVLLAVWQRWSAGDLYVDERANLTGLLCNWFLRNMKFGESNAIALRAGVQMDGAFWMHTQDESDANSEATQRTRRLYETVWANLQPSQRTVVSMRAEGYRFREIDEALGMRPRSAVTMMTQARRRAEKCRATVTG